MKETKVVISKNAQKELKKISTHVVIALTVWVEAVKLKGLMETRKVPGYHDEPLKGDRAGQRSVRLNKAYRAFYVVSPSGDIELVTVTEVNKHNY